MLGSEFDKKSLPRFRCRRSVAKSSRPGFTARIHDQKFTTKLSLPRVHRHDFIAEFTAKSSLPRFHRKEFVFHPAIFVASAINVHPCFSGDRHTFD
jgi:hypothetical protein